MISKFKVGDKVIPKSQYGEVLRVDTDEEGFLYWVAGKPTPIWKTGYFTGWFREEELEDVSEFSVITSKEIRDAINVLRKLSKESNSQDVINYQIKHG